MNLHVINAQSQVYKLEHSKLNYEKESSIMKPL